jgi:hypothetical protein
MLRPPVSTSSYATIIEKNVGKQSSKGYGSSGRPKEEPGRSMRKNFEDK